MNTVLPLRRHAISLLLHQYNFQFFFFTVYNFIKFNIHYEETELDSKSGNRATGS